MTCVPLGSPGLGGGATEQDPQEVVVLLGSGFLYEVQNRCEDTARTFSYTFTVDLDYVTLETESIVVL